MKSACRIAGGGRKPLQLAKLMSWENAPRGEIVSAGSCPAEAVWGSMPKRTS